jgi:hypothetical protein
MDENESFEIPDFSDPEFDNEKEVKKWRKEREDFVKYINECTTVIRNSFNASKSSHKNLKRFELHKLITTPFIVESFAGSFRKKDVFFSIIQYKTSARIARGDISGTDEYFVGVITLERSYPHTIILPETLGLKINNLFIRGDVDFRHAKWFSFKFHVITKDEDRLRRSFENIDLNRLNKFSNAEIEINENQCYFRANRKPVSLKEAEIFIELAKTICEIF